VTFSNNKNTLSMIQTYQLQFFKSFYCFVDYPLPNQTPKSSPIQTLDETLQISHVETVDQTPDSSSIHTPELTPDFTKKETQEPSPELTY